jgi:hypothetical protein
MPTLRFGLWLLYHWDSGEIIHRIGGKFIAGIPGDGRLAFHCPENVLVFSYV